MYCPVCNAEYRSGITVCSDCHVALVPNLPGREATAAGQLPDGYLVPLWTGEDLALHDRLLESLDEASIQFYDQVAGLDPRARRDDPMFIGRRPSFGFEVIVFSSQLVKAKQILEKFLDEEPEDTSLPDGDEIQNEPPPPVPNIEEKPTCEIWAGEEQVIADFVEAALRENGIPFRIETTGQGEAVQVRPVDELRAREIVREVLEGTPPK